MSANFFGECSFVSKCLAGGLGNDIDYQSVADALDLFMSGKKFRLDFACLIIEFGSPELLFSSEINSCFPGAAEPY
jgi:hypothetical protein